MESDVQSMLQTKLNQLFEGSEGVIGITHDIVLFGKSEEESRQMHA